MRFNQIHEARYDSRGHELSNFYTLVIVNPETVRAPYVYWHMGDLRTDKIPRKSTKFKTVEEAQQHIDDKRTLLDRKIKEEKAMAGNFEPWILKHLEESRERWNEVRIVHVVTTFVT